MSASVLVATLGAPRIGPRRELKAALESYWSGKTGSDALLEVAAGLRGANWARQHAAGITHIPSNDFSLYDQVLDTTVTVGAIPAGYGWKDGAVSHETYFALARGTQGEQTCCTHKSANDHAHTNGAAGLSALEMTKWFDTNYHYLVPEFVRGQAFELASTKVIDEFREAKALGYHTRPVLVGPVTFLKLGKSRDEHFDPLLLLPGLLPVYTEILRRLAAHGADWVQIDEPVLALDIDDATRAALRAAYEMFARAVPGLKIQLTSYFGPLGDNRATALALPVAGLHLDLTRASEQLDGVLKEAPAGLVLSLGVIDGRNVWRANLPAILDRIEPVMAKRGTDHLIVSSSCSLLHVPFDLALETGLDEELKGWLAFAAQKLDELSILGRALSSGRGAVKEELAASQAAVDARKASPRIHNAAVAARLAAVKPEDARRAHAFSERRKAQNEALRLPVFPTTTIGSFPQTGEVRKARAAHTRGELDNAGYDAFLRRETANAIRWQEEIGIDVLVHGEFERNDMVQYFGERLDGYAFTRTGWVQSYGSRCVRPPVIYGDVSRPEAMSVAWTTYAQSLTDKPVKGMLTGPITMLQWSFVRDDLSRADVCRQIALALRDEVSDLERAGISVIQIDEPAIREGLPLRKADWAHYLDWAVESFRLSSSGVRDATQIHTHMCYSEFNDIIDAIGAMDADVISIETSRSKMELLDAFITYRYPNEIGPGVYDIHAPRVPSVAEMEALLEKAEQRLAADQIWVNPDCGLKTRQWEEVRPALVNMVAAARALRARVEG
ncbi:5-methyltetrahydropteroyltriglutamate--homocysteine S-methyltransferase [Pseudochelatococcus sp. G4_1912]|uniref:5-methyltetrahydropteroyltriglutamate-- homocysteine S-methyltransferase n=1 Tax=Pseudochelatococcus sp. G4_1912 TaxID=3114288 RepID=UPI0039C6FD69